jgi:hypothetical protein
VDISEIKEELLQARENTNFAATFVTAAFFVTNISNATSQV